MHNKRFRGLSFLLALLLIFSLLLSCAGNTEDTGSTAPETAPPPADFVFVENGVCRVEVIRPEDVADGEAAYEAAKEIHWLLKRYSGDVNIRTDFLKKDQTHDASAREILIGITNYPETANMQSLVPSAAGGFMRTATSLSSIPSMTQGCARRKMP